MRSGFGPRYVVPRGFVSSRPLIVSNPHVVGRPVLASRVVSGDAWQLLGRGESGLAAQAFAQQIARDTSAGVPKVGFALAAADSGDLDKGVWAMRRAFRADAQGVGDMMLQDELRPVVARVTSAYENRANNKGMNPDAAFMMAALYQLRGDPEMASMAMEYAVGEDRGEGRPASTANLARLIREEVDALPMVKGRGWELLAEGQSQAARDAFVAQISGAPNAGAPKVGFALASAAGGDLDRGVWAMRRAFAMDPDHTGDMVLSGELRPLIERVTQAYEAAPQGADTMFMLAALYQLQDDSKQAMHAIEESVAEDESAPGANSLFRLVSTEVRMAQAGGDDPAADGAYDGERDSTAFSLPPAPVGGPPSPPEDLTASPPPAEETTAGKPTTADGEVHDYALDGPAMDQGTTGRDATGRRVTVIRPAPAFLRPAAAACGR